MRISIPIPFTKKQDKYMDPYNFEDKEGTVQLTFVISFSLRSFLSSYTYWKPVT